MHVVAFAPASRAEVDENGGVNIDGFPLTSCHIDHFPKRITVPLVLAAYTQGGREYDPCLYIVAKSPDGEPLNAVECSWHWPDQPGAPVKFWVLTRDLPIVVQSAGLYSVGLYDSLDATQTDHLFPLPVVQFNPLIPPRP